MDLAALAGKLKRKQKKGKKSAAQPEPAEAVEAPSENEGAETRQPCTPCVLQYHVELTEGQADDEKPTATI